MLHRKRWRSPAKCGLHFSYKTPVSCPGTDWWSSSRHLQDKSISKVYSRDVLSLGVFVPKICSCDVLSLDGILKICCCHVLSLGVILKICSRDVLSLVIWMICCWNLKKSDWGICKVCSALASSLFPWYRSCCNVVTKSNIAHESINVNCTCLYRRQMAFLGVDVCK